MRFAILLVALALVAAVFSDAVVVRRKRQGQSDGALPLSTNLTGLIGGLTGVLGGPEDNVGLRRRKRQGQLDGAVTGLIGGLTGVLGGPEDNVGLRRRKRQGQLDFGPPLITNLNGIIGELEVDERQLRRKRQEDEAPADAQVDVEFEAQPALNANGQI